MGRKRNRTGKVVDKNFVVQFETYRGTRKFIYLVKASTEDEAELEAKPMLGLELKDITTTIHKTLIKEA